MPITGSGAKSVCKKWFENEGIKQGESCLVECGMAKTDMGTFQCPNQCPSLCKTSEAKKLIFNVSYYYGLTPAERALAAKYPKKMLLAYKLSREAEDLCSNLFSASITNDESDACRHFIWAALLYKKFGFKFSQQILDAHEQDNRQPSEEKSMDLANNRLGLVTAGDLLKKNKLNKKALLEAFKKNLKQGSFIILKPKKKEAKK